jgi:hypothetical protein
MAMSKGRPDPAQVRNGSRFAGIRESAFALTLLLTASCGGSLYQVKPLATLSPMPATVAFVNLGSISVRAAPLLSDEESQELFESNLQLAGLLPVRIEIIHNSGEAIQMKKVRFRVRDAAGTEWKAISSKQAIARILKTNGVSSYNPDSRKTFEKEFRADELSLKTPLTHGEGRREGFLIFLAPRKDPVSSPHGLVLTIEGFAEPATLTLK